MANAATMKRPHEHVVDRDAEARRNPAPAEPGNDEPVTHCEWCGAEYPSPKEASSAD